MISSLFVLRNFERATQQLPPNLWRKTRGDLFEARHDYGWITAKQAFKRIHGRIKYSVMLLEEANEFADLGFVRRKFACLLGDFNKAVAVSCFFDLRKQKIQFDKINMLNFISTSFNELTC